MECSERAENVEYTVPMYALFKEMGLIPPTLRLWPDRMLYNALSVNSRPTCQVGSLVN